MPHSPDHRYDLFISYADADRSWVEGYLLDALRAAGVTFHTKADFVLGQPRLAQFERAVQESYRTLLVLSPAYLADEARAFVDLLAQNYGLKSRTWPIIPLILHPTNLPDRLEMLESLDATDPDEWGMAIGRLCAELNAPEAGAVTPQPQSWSTIKVMPPPKLVPLPDVSRFVGREQELTHYIDLLRENHVAVIAGLAGVGKTALAVKLALRVAKAPSNIFWHQFHADEGIDTVIFRLAGLLYHHERRTLWEMLEGARQSGGRPHEREILLDHLIELLPNQGYVLCLDDFHYAEEDPLFAKAVEKLQPLLLKGDVDLIVTSRRIPELVRNFDFTQLTGLSAQDTDAFITASKITLSPELLTELHRRTEGNPELLTLAALTLKRNRRAGQVIQRLASEEDIETFLLREVDNTLADDKKLVMNGVAVLLGHPGTRSAIETTLASGSIKRALRFLANRFLLREQEGPHDEEYLTHAIVQEFYYELLGRHERQEMHQRAGEFYENEERDLLRATIHYQRAGDAAHAADLAVTDIWGIVNQGKAHQLRTLLEAVEQLPLNPESRLRLLVSLGDLLDFLGEGKAAQERYRRALNVLTQVQSATVRSTWEARACLGMGATLEHHSPKEALIWLEKGLTAVGDGDATVQAALRNRIGSVYIGLADYGAAMTTLLQALALLPETPGQMRMKVLTNLNSACALSGETAQSSQYADQALVMSEQLHDFYEMLAIRSEIGIAKEVSGDWAGAGADYEEALKLAEQVASPSEQARLHNLLGTLRLHQGDDAAAEGHLRAAIRTFRVIDNPEYLAATLPVLAQLHLRRAEWEAASADLSEAERLATAAGWEYILPETYTTQAQLALMTDDPVTAQQRADQAIEVAARLEQPVEEAKAWRVKGQALAASPQIDGALGALERSIELLSGQDPYELALTQMELAHVVAANGDNLRSNRLLAEANAALIVLGVKDRPNQAWQSSPEDEHTQRSQP